MHAKFILIILTISLFSCKKNHPELSATERQKQQEKATPLKWNELLEEHGLTFVINSPVTDTSMIEIDLKLYKGSGATKSTTPIHLVRNSYMNYGIVSDSLEDNSEYTLTMEHIRILQDAPYEILAEGFTSQYGSKELIIPGKSFTTSSAGTFKDILLIKKGVLKFTVYEL